MVFCTRVQSIANGGLSMRKCLHYNAKRRAPRGNHGKPPRKGVGGVCRSAGVEARALLQSFYGVLSAHGRRGGSPVRGREIKVAGA